MLLLLLAGAALFYFLRHEPLEKGHAQLSERVDQLSGDNTKLNDRVSTLEKERDELRSERDRLQQAHDELKERLEAREARIEELEDAQQSLQEQLEEEIESGEVHITGGDGELAVGLADKILFPPGEAELSDGGKDVLRRVAAELVGLEDQVIQVGGHTDNQPLSKQLQDDFATNWELSTARATNVVRFLTDECDIPGERLVAAGFSQYRPAASNRTPQGRRRNRRIQLTLLAKPEPPGGRD